MESAKRDSGLQNRTNKQYFFFKAKRPLIVRPLVGFCRQTYDLASFNLSCNLYFIFRCCLDMFWKHQICTFQMKILLPGICVLLYHYRIQYFFSALFFCIVTKVKFQNVMWLHTTKNFMQASLNKQSFAKIKIETIFPLFRSSYAFVYSMGLRAQ